MHAQLCLTLCDLADCSQSGSSIHGVFQAWTLEGVAISYSRGSPWLRAWTCVSCISYMEKSKKGLTRNLWSHIFFWAFLTFIVQNFTSVLVVWGSFQYRLLLFFSLLLILPDQLELWPENPQKPFWLCYFNAVTYLFHLHSRHPPHHPFLWGSSLSSENSSW